MKAFVLGAGLGTRLRPLTERRPKPLVPIYGKPLITFAFDHLIATGITSFVVNTHHCPEAYGAEIPGGMYRGCPIAWIHEPVLLDTGGGIKNAEHLLGSEPFLVYNGDVLADFPLRPAIDRHLASGNLASLVLRSCGGPLHVQCRDGLVCDIRHSLGAPKAPSFLFTGITILSPEIFGHIPAGQIVSIIPIYLNLLRAGFPLGGIIADDGLWFDLGSRDSYLEAHALLQPGGHRLSYVPADWPQARQEPSSIAPSAKISGATSIGRNCSVGEDAFLEDSILWDGATVVSGSHLRRCIVRDGSTAEGHANDRDW